MFKTFTLFYLMALTSLLACLDSNSGSVKKDFKKSKDSEVVFRIAHGAEIHGLDPAKVVGAIENSILMGLFEGLLFSDPVYSNPTLGSAASRPIISDDGLVYTFALRNDLKWSDGERLTAHDFVYGHMRMLDPKVESQYANLLYPIVGAKEYNEGKLGEEAVKIVALDDLTLEYTLKSPTAYFLGAMTHMAFYPHPRHVIEKNGINWTKNNNFVGNGPYKLKKWVRDSYMEMERNPHYFDAEVLKIDRITFYPTDDDTTAYNMFKNDEVDWNSGIFPAAMIDEVYKRPDVHVRPIFANKFFIYNLGREPFKDVRVRKALTLALDMDTLINNVLRNGAMVTGSLVPPLKGPTYEPIVMEALERFNPEQAKWLLADAGFPGGKGFPAVVLSYNTSDENRLLCEWTQEQWKKHLGIDVKLQNQEWSVFLNNLDSHKFFVTPLGWSADFKDPVTFLDLFLKSNVIIHNANYHNPKFEVLMEKASKMSSGKERFKVLRAAEMIVLKDYPVIPISFESKVHLIDTEKWGGWSTNMLDMHSLKTIYPKNKG